MILDEWKITLVIRTTNDQRPDKWDYTELLDLATGAGEQAWIEFSGVERSGTESELDSGESVDSREPDPPPAPSAHSSEPSCCECASQQHDCGSCPTFM